MRMILLIFLCRQFYAGQIYHVQGKTVAILLKPLHVYQFICSVKFRRFLKQRIIKETDMYYRFHLPIILPVV